MCTYIHTNYKRERAFQNPFSEGRAARGKSYARGLLDPAFFVAF